MTNRPLIAIAPDIAEPAPGRLRLECPLTYTRAVSRAGGLPLVLDPEVALIPGQLVAFDAFLLIGGDDPRTEPFGYPTHPAANTVPPQRQAKGNAQLRALIDHPHIPVLAVCLGMQMLGLCAGLRLDQHMPETLGPDAARLHRAEHGDTLHTVAPAAGNPASLPPGEMMVASRHRQRLLPPTSGPTSRAAIAAIASDGTVEAITMPGHAFALGVQWHPERTPEPPLGHDLFARLIDAARARRDVRPSKAP
ncbi:MAG: gamma-glutamyl-gamma-aminobutyrate hydrolase family protein [Phycisphaerales bacterium]